MNPSEDSPKKIFHINVNFDEIREIAHRGMRRAAIFMGLGMNAASNESFKDYQLSRITGVELVSPNATDEQIVEFKKEFSYWITGNGLRELLETFNIFLDGLHESCLVMQGIKLKNLTEQEARDKRKKFHYIGLPDKLVILKREFQIAPENLEYLLSINKARNCLTHRRGIVGQPDVGADGKLHLKWRGIDLFIKTPAGEEITILPGKLAEPLYLKDGGAVMLRFPVMTKTFSIGERLILTSLELTEFCQIVAQETDAINAQGIEYAKKLGIPRKEEDKSPA